MARRLVDLYQPGDPVEIYLEVGRQSGWRPGRVMDHDFPGVWVQTGGGRWFVTNHRRIRPRTDETGPLSANGM